MQYAKKEAQRTAAYRDLLKRARKTVGYATAAIPLAKNNADIEGLAWGAELERYVGLSRQVIEQTERRVLKGEKVPAALSPFSSRTPTSSSRTAGTPTMATRCVFVWGPPT